MSVSNDFMQYLATGNHGKPGASTVTGATAHAWRLFTNLEPEQNADRSTIVLSDTGGGSPEHSMSTQTLLLSRPTLQIRVAAVGAEAAHAKMVSVLAALVGQAFVGTSGNRYNDIRKNGDILFLKKDERSRTCFVCNLRMVQYPAA